MVRRMYGQGRAKLEERGLGQKKGGVAGWLGSQGGSVNRAETSLLHTYSRTPQLVSAIFLALIQVFGGHTSQDSVA